MDHTRMDHSWNERLTRERMEGLLREAEQERLARRSRSAMRPSAAARRGAGLLARPVLPLLRRLPLRAGR
jgi:hypothetical protein